VQQSRLAGQEPGLQAVQKAVTRFREALETPLDIEALASELKVSYRWFRRAFSHHTGLSPHRYLLDIRLARARQLLSHGSLSIKEIALRTGFEDANYFSRLFHKKMGVSAGVWRARAQKGRLG
jgi:AraC family L-rhamnose operon regulatory protein RhaS